MRGLVQSARFFVLSYMHNEVQHPFKAKISETFAGEPSFRKLVMFCAPLNIPFALYLNYATNYATS